MHQLAVTSNSIMESPAAEKAEAKPSQSSEPYQWIIHPIVDLLFCCGGLLWVLFALHEYLGTIDYGQNAFALLLVSGAAAHLLSETHQTATIVRLYETKEMRSRFARYSLIAAALCAAFSSAALFTPWLLALLLRIYLFWIVQHFCAQVYGIALLYCMKNKYYMSSMQKTSLSWMLMSLTFYAIVRQFTPGWGAESFLGIELGSIHVLPSSVAHAAEMNVLAATTLFCLFVCNKAVSERQFIPTSALVLISTCVAIFLMPRGPSGVLWLYVPAFFHGAQYLVVSTATHLKERGYPEQITPRQLHQALFNGKFFRYYLRLALLALVLFLALPVLLTFSGASMTTAFACVFVALSFHHFVTDQAIWKLRDARTRQILVS